MKKKRFFIIVGVLITAVVMNAPAQEVLPEVTVMARNYKYLRSSDAKNAPTPVNLLERKAAAYDVRNSDFYEDEYDTYSITFYLPEGYVLGVYDKDGKLLSTAEKFKNITVPVPVRNAVATRYPNWSITRDVYRVNYEDETGAKMVYKLLLENGKKRLKVKTNEKGEFLD
jgi:hypothetical protein